MDVLRELGTVVWLRGELDEVLARARRSGEPADARRAEPGGDRRALPWPRGVLRAGPRHRGHGGLGIDQVVARILAALRERHAARV